MSRLAVTVHYPPERCSTEDRSSDESGGKLIAFDIDAPRPTLFQSSGMDWKSKMTSSSIAICRPPSQCKTLSCRPPGVREFQVEISWTRSPCSAGAPSASMNTSQRSVNMHSVPSRASSPSAVGESIRTRQAEVLDVLDGADMTWAISNAVQGHLMAFCRPNVASPSASRVRCA